MLSPAQSVETRDPGVERTPKPPEPFCQVLSSNCGDSQPAAGLRLVYRQGPSEMASAARAGGTVVQARTSKSRIIRIFRLRVQSECDRTGRETEEKRLPNPPVPYDSALIVLPKQSWQNHQGRMISRSRCDTAAPILKVIGDRLAAVHRAHRLPRRWS